MTTRYQVEIAAPWGTEYLEFEAPAENLAREQALVWQAQQGLEQDHTKICGVSPSGYFREEAAP